MSTFMNRNTLESFLLKKGLKKKEIPADDNKLIGKLIQKSTKDDMLKILKSFGVDGSEIYSRAELGKFIRYELMKGLWSSGKSKKIEELEIVKSQINNEKVLISPEESVVSSTENSISIKEEPYPDKVYSFNPYQKYSKGFGERFNMNQDLEEEWDEAIVQQDKTKKSSFVTAGKKKPIETQCLDIIKYKKPKRNEFSTSDGTNYKLPSVKEFHLQLVKNKKKEKDECCKLTIHVDKSRVVEGDDGNFYYILMIYVYDEIQKRLFWCYNARVVRKLFQTISMFEIHPTYKHFEGFDNYVKRIHPDVDKPLTSGKESNIPVHFIAAMVKHLGIDTIEKECERLIQEIFKVHQDEKFQTFFEQIWRSEEHGNPEKFINSLRDANKTGKGLNALKNAKLEVKVDVPLNNHFLNCDIPHIVGFLHNNNNLANGEWSPFITNLTGLKKNPFIRRRIKEEEDEMEEGKIIELD